MTGDYFYCEKIHQFQNIGGEYKIIRIVDGEGNFCQYDETMDGKRFGRTLNMTVQKMGYKDTKEFLDTMKRRNDKFIRKTGRQDGYEHIKQFGIS